MEILVTNIQRFSVHDGPGIRTTVFLKGCPLNCAWCHNPETKNTGNEILYNDKLCIKCGLCASVCPSGAHVITAGAEHNFAVSLCRQCMACAAACPSRAIEPAGKYFTGAQIIAEIKRDLAFYGAEGGLTLSGGEPLLHMEASLWLLKEAKEANISTAVETSGYFDSAYIEQLAGLVDWFLWDYKDTDSARHKKYTGVGNERIIQQLLELDQYQVKIILRCIILAGHNSDDNHLAGISALYHRLKSCVGVELIPYHTFGGSKNKALGYQDTADTKWIPSPEELAGIRQRLAKAGVKLI